MAGSQLSQAAAYQEALGQQALQYGGVTAMPDIQRAQMMADMLQRLQDTAGPTIRTPGALASNLLAEFISQIGSSKANAKLKSEIGAGATGRANDSQVGIYAPPPGPSATAGAPDIHDAYLASVTGQPPPPPQAAASDPKADTFARLLLGEGGDMRADADVVANRAKLAGTDIMGAISAPHQFEPYDNPTTWARLQAVPTSSPAYQKALDVARDEMANGPHTNFDHFYGPAAQAALARRDGRPVTPSWDNGTGQDINGQRYFALGYGGHPALAQGGQAQAGAMPQAQPSPFAPPQQGAAQPPAPQGPPGAPPAAPGPSMQGGAAGGQGGPPTGSYATPEEADFIHRGLAYPVGSEPWQRAVAKSEEIQQRHMTPVGLQPGYTYGPNGRAMPIPGMEYQTTANGPAGGYQRGPNGQVSSFSNPNVGAIPAGAAAGYDQNGQAQVAPLGGMQRHQLSAQEVAAAGLAPGTVASRDPFTHELKVDQAPQYGSGEALRLRQDLQSNAQFNESREAAKAYGAMVQLAQQNPGGMRAYALRDTFARVINPKGAVRLGTIQAIAETQGLPANIKGFFMNLHGDGPVPPEIVQQILDSAFPFAKENYGIASGMNNDNAALAGRHPGIDPRDVVLDIGDAPQPFNLAQWQTQQQGQGQPAAAGHGSGGNMFGMPPGMNPTTVIELVRQHGYRLQGGRLYDASGKLVPGQASP